MEFFPLLGPSSLDLELLSYCKPVFTLSWRATLKECIFYHSDPIFLMEIWLSSRSLKKGEEERQYYCYELLFDHFFIGKRETPWQQRFSALAAQAL